jgi:hypothetical protein
MERILFPKVLEMERIVFSKVRFWHDLWCGKQHLKISYPDLFSIAHCKYACVADHVQFRNGNLHGNLCFFRLVNDWEVERVSSHSHRVSQGG